MRNAPLSLLAGLLALVLPPTVALLPYNPTAVLPSTRYGEILYIFRQESKDLSTLKLLSLNTSGVWTSNTLPTTTISEILPFTNKENGTSYIPFTGNQGNIYVYAGQCSDGPGGATLWGFTPAAESLNGTWLQKTASVDSTVETSNYQGPGYLTAGMDFSSTVNGSSDFYAFGGMCPNSTALDVQDWQASANYSDSMITLQPLLASSGVASGFEISSTSSRGPPIPEAGFTATGLQPTFFNSSDGSSSQQQTFALLGGHTQYAFINMSQVALFSLPQQTWTFLPLDDPRSTVKTGLAARTTDTIEPRSGHTAVLTSDGKQIVVFGGWVGDITTPANPQLALLQVGEGYGGDGDWQWTIPDTYGSGPPTGVAIFGHGATMLPGEVMMVIGGFTTPPSTMSSGSGILQNTATYFFNVSSRTWLSSYTNPAMAFSPHSTLDLGSDTSSLAKIGLGAGLGLGLALVAALLLAFFCYHRRVRRRKAVRDKELRDLALGAQRFHSSAIGLGGIDGRGGEQSAVEWMGRGGHDAYPWAQQHIGTEENVGGRGLRYTNAERTGLLVEIPSPTRGLRRSAYARGGHHHAARYDDGRRSLGSGNIHPIDERDEYEEGRLGQDPSATQEMSQSSNVDLFATAPNFDPFLDPLGSHPVGISRTPSPDSPARERQREVQGWVSDWTAAENLMYQQASQSSPDRGDRTSSTLSDRSTHSTVSALSFQPSVGTVSRSLSQRSAHILNSNPFKSASPSANPSPTFDTRDNRMSSQGQHSDYRRSQSLTLDLAHRRTNTAETFSTAATSFAQLQSEGETLLGGHQVQSDTRPNRSHSSRAKGWVGTMRRAFTGGDRSTSRSPDGGDHSSSSSPTKPHHGDAGIPRRAASAGAMVWRRRQGARDWDVDGNEGDGATTNNGPEEEEWDVESAVERRVVQVMFTVPREKLRVVNAGPDGDGVSIVSMEREKAGEKAEPQGKGRQTDGDGSGEGV
ncbi:hypothetical protein MMC30_003304 [Trapelia coarctata]|nr:hypothetical protein [Trapelia coarctata]